MPKVGTEKTRSVSILAAGKNLWEVRGADSLHITASDSKRRDNLTFMKHVKICTVLITSYHLSLLNTKKRVLYPHVGYLKIVLFPGY